MELTVQMSEPARALVVHVHSHSHTGNRESNQDRFGAMRRGPLWCGVVADGAGGHQAGEVAADLAVQTVLDAWSQSPQWDAQALRDLLELANQQILHAQSGEPACQGMHSTACVLVINTSVGAAVHAHVGDSRVYHFRGDAVLNRTQDHSVLQWLINQGRSPEGQARNALYTALGEPPAHFVVDTSPQPVMVLPGDWFLMCSDGLWEFFSDEELALLGQQLRASPAFFTHLHHLVMQRAQGQADNFTGLAVFVD
ncbi:MAG TPA: protein phosphatase 2C domain-containing protein [Limnobacter sp.]|nr:protein phosphatase 2C domain-containing protein [Limnobacter sp.]